jgi:two-component system, OmpR family, sensor histidine kinase QseC
MLLLAQATHAPEYLADLADEVASLRGTGKLRNELMLEFVVTRADGTLVAKSLHGPEMLLTDQPGYTDIDHEGNRWRSLMLTTANGEYGIRVAQLTHLLDEEALEIATEAVFPMLLFIPVLLGLIYFSVRHGLKPLDDLAGEVAARSPESLHALDHSRAPREAQPLVIALNRLLQRLGNALGNERRFTADAAHELRTPLAAIRIQAQVAIASADASERQHALHQVVAGTDRATRLVEQLLRLARLDPLARVPDPQSVDIVALMHDAINTSTVREWAARRDDIRVEAAAEPVVVAGDADLLAVALRNLIDNAVRYTAPGCEIVVFARYEYGEPVLGVRDSGPGVREEELPRLIERFYRGHDPGAEGSGLGLAIVRRIAELHGARLKVDNIAAGGFIARLRWFCV